MNSFEHLSFLEADEDPGDTRQNLMPGACVKRQEVSTFSNLQFDIDERNPSWQPSRIASVARRI